jgi:hypothetical protein
MSWWRLKLSSDGHDSWVLSPEGRLARLGKCPVEHRPMQVGSLHEMSHVSRLDFQFVQVPLQEVRMHVSSYFHTHIPVLGRLQELFFLTGVWVSGGSRISVPNVCMGILPTFVC